jgi:hypothetical protein
MSAEEDKKFDAVLGGFLVNNLRVRAGDSHCPESDTLAAYHGRSLLPDEMNSWKEHIAGCARCQAILAELEATDSISLQPLEKEEVVTAVASAASAAGEARSSRKEVSVTLPDRSRVTSISRGVRWQWLAPAGALAAGLLIWVAWHENRTLQVKAPAEFKTAKLEPPTTLPPSVARDGRQSVSAEEVAQPSKNQGAVGGAVAPKPARETRSLKQFEKAVSRARVTSSEPQTDREAGTRADTALDSLAATNRARSQPAQDAKAGAAGGLSQTVEVQTLTANAQPQNQQAQQNLQVQQRQLNEQKVSGPNPSKQPERAKKLKSEAATNLDRAAPPPAPAPAAAAFDESVRATSTLMARGQGQHLISAPGAKSLWHVGPMSMIEFSSDGGASWSRQISNVSMELTAGFAPSDKVCWVVGRAGTILLTADAGSHWTTIHSPLDEDLGGVRATDALHATVWNAPRTKIFETFDGGATWKLVASP